MKIDQEEKARLEKLFDCTLEEHWLDLQDLLNEDLMCGEEASLEEIIASTFDDIVWEAMVEAIRVRRRDEGGKR